MCPTHYEAEGALRGHQSLNELAAGKLSMLQQHYMSAMAIDPLPTQRFVAADNQVRVDVSEALKAPGVHDGARPPKAPKADTSYKSEHFELFRAYDLLWPAEIKDEYDGGFHILHEGMSSRQLEICIVCHTIFPRVEQDLFSFMDANPWLGMIASQKNTGTATMKSPWSEHPRTIV